MPKFSLLTVILIGLFMGIVRAQTSQVVTNGQGTTPVSFPGATCIYTWSNNNPAIGLRASGTGISIHSPQQILAVPLLRGQ